MQHTLASRARSDAALVLHGHLGTATLSDGAIVAVLAAAENQRIVR
jgi:hypothetical protein